MKNINYETKNLFATSKLQKKRLRERDAVRNAFCLTGMALAVVLGAVLALSAPSFAQAESETPDTTPTVEKAGDGGSVVSSTNIRTAITTDTTTTTVSTVEASGDITGTIEKSGVFVSHEADHDITITSEAKIKTVKHGIEAIHSGDGKLEIVNEGKIKKVEKDGIHATHSGDDLLKISSTKGIEAKNRAISALHSGVGDIEFSTDSSVEGEGEGVYARHTGSGDLKISTEDRKNGSGGEITAPGRGIFVRHEGSSGNIDVDISSGGSVISRANDAIFIEHGGTGDSDGDIKLDIHGEVSGRYAGISIDHNASSNPYNSGGFLSTIDIDVHSGSSVSAVEDAIRVRSVEVPISIGIAGSVSSTEGKAIDIISGRTVSMQLHPGFSLNGSVVVEAHPRKYSTPEYHLELHSTLADSIGFLDLSNEEFRGFDFLKVRGLGTWEVTGIASENEAFLATEILPGATLRFSNANFKIVEGDIYAFVTYGPVSSSGLSAGVLEVTGSNRLRGHFENHGKLVFVPGDTHASLAVSGDYWGAYSHKHELVFNVDIAGHNANKLTIEGDSVGRYYRPGSISMRTSNLLNAGSPPAEELPILVEVRGSAEAGDFEGEQTVGAYDYVLAHDTANAVNRWRFRRRGLSSPAAAGASSPTALSELAVGQSAASGLGEGSHDLGFRDNTRRYAGGAWAQQQNSRILLEPGTVADSRLHMEDNRVRFGFDLPATSFMGGDVVVGASMWQGLSTADVSSSAGKGVIGVESHATALTASWQSGEGFYADGQTQYVRFLIDISADRLSLVQDNEGIGMSASAEAGYRLAVPLGGMDLHIAPQVEVVWSRVGFDDFVGPHGELVSLEDGDLVRGRLGLSWDGEWRNAEGTGHVYGGMNLRDALDGRTSVNVSGVSLASEQRGLSVDGRVGVSYEWNEGYAVHGEAMALRRDEAEEFRVNLGVRIEF